MTVRLNSTVLEEHLLRRNVSRNDFAQSATLSGGYLAQLLAGKRNPSGRVREKLLTASGMTFDDLFLIIREGNGATKEKNDAEVTGAI